MAFKHLVMIGEMRSEDGLALMNHYLTRLNLTGVFDRIAPGRIGISLQGEEDLIDMFEIACWLGPETGQVFEVQVTDHSGGFTGE